MSIPLGYDYYDNGLYGLPQVTDFLALLYNKKEVKKAVGTTSPPSTMYKFQTYAEDVVLYKAAKYELKRRYSLRYIYLPSETLVFFSPLPPLPLLPFFPFIPPPAVPLCSRWWHAGPARPRSGRQ